MSAKNIVVLTVTLYEEKTGMEIRGVHVLMLSYSSWKCQM